MHAQPPLQPLQKQQQKQQQQRNPSQLFSVANPLRSGRGAQEDAWGGDAWGSGYGDDGSGAATTAAQLRRAYSRR